MTAGTVVELNPAKGLFIVAIDGGPHAVWMLCGAAQLEIGTRLHGGLAEQGSEWLTLSAGSRQMFEAFGEGVVGTVWDCRRFVWAGQREVDVVQCLRDGQQLPEGERGRAHRGWLRLGYLTVADECTLHADLYFSDGGGSPPMLFGLSQVEVVSPMGERAMRLAGLQHGDPYAPTPKPPPQRQVWVCEPVPSR